MRVIRRESVTGLLMTGAGAAMALVLVGCTGTEPPREIAVVRDSAGVRIVENAPPADPAPYAVLASEPTLDIGTLDGAEPYQLFNVGDVTRLEDGTIVVADGGSKELRFFDSAGVFRSAAGREGEGPGEFKGMGRVVQVGDSLHVYDWSLRRVSVFDAAGVFARSYRVDLPGCDAPWVVDALANGTWIVTKGFVFSPTKISAVVRDTVPYHLITPDDGELIVLGQFPGVEFFVYGDAQRTSASSVVFGRTTVAAAGNDVAAVSANDAYEVAVFGSDGTMRHRVRRTHTPRPVTQADIDAGKAKRLAEAPNDNFRRQVEPLFLEMPIPGTMPAFDELRVDALGFLWVRDPLSPVDAEGTWHVYGADGRWVGIVTTPTEIGVREIGEDYVLATWQDELDVEHVRLYALNRSSSGERD